MSTPANTLKSAQAVAIIAALDAGVGAATLEICTASYANVLVVVPLQEPCGTQANGLITFGGMPIEAGVTITGIPAIARIKDGGGTVQIDGMSVGTSGTDVIIPTTAAWPSGATARVTSMTYRVN